MQTITDSAALLHMTAWSRPQMRATQLGEYLAASSRLIVQAGRYTPVAGGHVRDDYRWADLFADDTRVAVASLNYRNPLEIDWLLQPGMAASIGLVVIGAAAEARKWAVAISSELRQWFELAADRGDALYEAAERARQPRQETQSTVDQARAELAYADALVEQLPPGPQLTSSSTFVEHTERTQTVQDLIVIRKWSRNVEFRVDDE